MAKNKLSIYLIKEENIFEEESKTKIKVLKEYSTNKTLYHLPSYIHEPNWLKSFLI